MNALIALGREFRVPLKSWEQCVPRVRRRSRNVTHPHPGQHQRRRGCDGPAGHRHSRHRLTPPLQLPEMPATGVHYPRLGRVL
jgi:hypothetical protein